MDNRYISHWIQTSLSENGWLSQVLHSSIVHSFERQHKFHPSKQKGVGQKLIESV